MSGDCVHSQETGRRMLVLIQCLVSAVKNQQGGCWSLACSLLPSIFIFNLGLQYIRDAATHIDWVFPAQLKFP